MKRILMTIVATLLVTGLFAQHTDGVKGGNWKPRRTKENVKDSTYFNIAPTFKAGQYIDMSETTVKLYPDTVEVTVSKTLALTDVGKRLRVKGTHISIILPPASSVAFTKEATIYVQLMTAATVLHFVKGSGVSTISVKDSLNGNTKNKWYGLVYYGGDNWNLIGVED
jgi:hypothetical protein